MKLKDSKVLYIGYIPEKWNVLRNKNVFTCAKSVVGLNSNATNLLSLTTKGIREKDINNADGKLPESFDTYQYVYKDDIVMCLFDLDVSAVFSGLSQFDGMISPAYKVLRCKNNIFPEYADYWFKYIFDGRKFNHYAKNIRYTLNYEDFSTLPILAPPYETQLQIAEYLNDKCKRIDTILVNQQKLIEKLKAYKLSFINEITSYVDGIKCHLGYVGIMKNGLNFSTMSEGKPFKFLGVGDFKEYYFLNNIDMFSSIITSDEINDDYLLKDGDIVFVRSNGSKDLVGRSVMVENIDFPLTFSGFCIRFRNIRSDIIDSKYLLYFFRSPGFRKQLEKHSRGSNINNMNQDLLSHIEFTFPSLEEQKKAVIVLEEKCKKIDFAIERKQLIIDKLITYKKSLIYEVVTGKKEV